MVLLSHRTFLDVMHVYTRVIQELMTMNSSLGKYYYTQFYLLCHMGTQILPIHA